MKHYACDYIGNYQGAYFEFEAKETAQEYFAWKQIRPSQHAKLQQILATKGYAFLIIYFERTNQFFFVTYQALETYILNNTQKIPLGWFQETQTELKINEELKLNYLALLDK